jgi:hypothetical protein
MTRRFWNDVAVGRVARTAGQRDSMPIADEYAYAYTVQFLAFDDFVEAVLQLFLIAHCLHRAVESDIAAAH